MAGIAFLTRKALVHQSNVFVGSGADFGAQLTSAFTRITGLASVIGSMTIRLRNQIDLSGPFLVASNWSVSSGVNFLDVPNRADYTYINVTAANSQVCTRHREASRQNADDSRPVGHAWRH